MTGPTRNDYTPKLDEVVRFMRSNPLTSFEALAEILKIGDDGNAMMSGGRFRELWRINGGAFDKKGRAWIETDLLPQILRRIIDTNEALHKGHP